MDRTESAAIDLSALGATAGTASVTTITGDDLLVENDETDPRHVAPVTSTEAIEAGKPFRHTFPKASVTVLQIGLEQ
jgi:alpha-L-arabinofuranosidase